MTNQIEVQLFIVLLTLVFSVSSLTPKVVIKSERILWEKNGAGQVAEFRIPLLIQLPTGDLLAFSEARKFSGADAGAKFIAMRRSSDGGDTWEPNVFLLDDFSSVPDGMNLGTVLVEHETEKLILIHTFCIHSTPTCVNGTGEKAAGVYMITSLDWGYTWSKPVYLADQNPHMKDVHWDPGPGYGIQKMYPPHKGRLVACGHGCSRLFCLVSDDKGVSWQMTPGISNMPPTGALRMGDFYPGEVQVVELSNGTLLINARNQMLFRCNCRIQALSFDGGETFPVPYVTLKKELIDPRVCASLLNFNNTLFFSNPFNAKSRINLTLHWSEDSGETYPNSLQIHPKGSGYSCLSSIGNDHIGMVYEKDGCQYIAFLKFQVIS